MTPTYTPQLLAALSLFAFAASITPGPNNSMLMASGANFGLRASLPHMWGVTIGFIVLLTVCGLGLAGVFVAFPVLQEVLKWGGAAYLLYLAWKIGTAKGIGVRATTERPISFLGAAAFQFVNPKGWVMALGAVSTYVPTRGFLANLAVALLIFALISVLTVFIWTAFGMGVRRLLNRPATLRVFNVVMALLLVASLYPLFNELHQ
ncbi:LysE family translocator [Caulobacter sp. S45]|jgi:threonine/homoserine/homoserine lactone efflux protein|uniref:LysE family translocator n=1 Tax=Caulobacter sp. S45 TaxID=1641861 RepID=UPI00131E71A2|nr:LysE family translocator [Caulobacter sp. S45]